VPAHAGLSEQLSAGDGYVTLQLQLCLVSSSPNKVRQFSVECCPVSQRSVPGSTSCPALGGPFALSLCTFLDLC
jgi:hypothetical protein